MSRSKFHPSRRSFLRGLGGVAVSLPFLNMGLPGSELFAQDMGTKGFPKRFIFMIHPNGVIEDQWFPVAGATEREFTLRPEHKALESFKSKLIYLKNAHLSAGSTGPGEPHQKGMGGILTGRPLNEGEQIGGDGSRAGWGSGVSIDQYMARTLGKHNKVGALTLGVRADNTSGSDVRSRLSYSGSDQPVPPENAPLNVFKRLFSDFMTDDGTVDRLRADKLSVLDGISDQFKGVYNRAGYDDRMRLQRHFTKIREIEERLRNETIATGNSCAQPATPQDVEPNSEDTMPGIIRAHIDLMVMAMACDLTRFATIQISNAMNHIRFPWVDSLGDGHSLSHAGDSNTMASKEWSLRGAWYAEQFAYMLDALNSVLEGDGTMLDNTVVVWTSEISRGNTHSQQDMPLLMAGSAGGAFDTGRYVQYGGAGKSTNDLLVSILNAMGLQDTTYGDARFCTGPLSGIS